MKNIKEIVAKFETLKGAKFIAINGYEATTTGEIANHVINTNISVMNAKLKDLETLKSVTADDIEDIKLSSSQSIATEIYNMALTEMKTSAEKNVSENKEDRTAQSVAQTDAFIHISNALKVNKNSGELHVFGMAIAKTIIVAGEYKTVKSREKTIAKKQITKHTDLRAKKFRTFIVGNIENVKLNGETLEINC